ncbi:MAG: hypothetical protein OXC42_07170 [Gammaproteobacteria bacterium]|nr:hypothetical protein [Gammaproteobacteria bacterium]
MRSQVIDQIENYSIQAIFSNRDTAQSRKETCVREACVLPQSALRD